MRISPHIITHYKPIDFELEKECEKLRCYLWQHKVVGIIRKTIYARANPWKMKYKSDQKKNNFFHYTMSATEIAERFQDVRSEYYLKPKQWEI